LRSSDGTLTLCRSYEEHPELCSAEHHTTGHNYQVASDTNGNIAWISERLAGSTHDKATWDQHHSAGHVHVDQVTADNGYQRSGTITSDREPVGGRLAESDHQRNIDITKIRWASDAAKAHMKTRRTPRRLPQTAPTYTQEFYSIRALIFFTRAVE
jgi:hypothetical protein